jgi:hypothetical protein
LTPGKVVVSDTVAISSPRRPARRISAEHRRHSGILQQRSAHRSAMLAEHLQRALNSRVVIEQAKGVLAERNGVSMVIAFDSLRLYARDQNIKLTDLAYTVVHNDFNPTFARGR